MKEGLGGGAGSETAGQFGTGKAQRVTILYINNYVLTFSLFLIVLILLKNNERNTATNWEVELNTVGY